MKPRLTVVTLGVENIARARSFYEAMGLSASADSNDSVVFFEAGGVILALWGRKDLAADAGVPESTGGSPGVCLAWNVGNEAEVDDALKMAAAAGARVVKPAMKAFWGGYLAYFADPDGHLWEITYNPFWGLDASGRIALPPNPA